MNFPFYSESLAITFFSLAWRAAVGMTIMRRMTRGKSAGRKKQKK
jgi:hypothetical protein